MSVIEKLNNIKDTIPHYWPIGSFIHHNPLKGFEDMNFKDALDKAQGIFGGKVYMNPSYYLGLYNQGKIDPAIFEKNISKLLNDNALDVNLDQAKNFLMQISPKLQGMRSEIVIKDEEISSELLAHLKQNSQYLDKSVLLTKLLEHMTLYEINDALFHTDKKEIVEKEVIEYISRFLDEEQTTLSMSDRNLGMFGAFKLYEGIDYSKDAETYVKEALETLKVDNVEEYLLTHILKLHGWAGFIKYRSEDEDYFSQRQNPSSLIEYMAVRLYFELKYTQKNELNNFEELRTYFEKNDAYGILKLLKYKGKLPGTYIDEIEEHKDYEDILGSYIENELKIDALLIQSAKSSIADLDISFTEFAIFVSFMKKEEGFLWLKSLEDSYIHKYIDEFTTEETIIEQPLASATFCLDVRSEIMRRNVEKSGPYVTYGIGGFLGIPIAFVEFDKAHELFLSPAVIKPKNVVFEIPNESYEDYSSKKGVTKTAKKVLSDLKNNPYTPYIMVEAIGWIFGIALFGKTFFPRKTEKLFGKMKPKKPKTTYTLDKLSAQEIEIYVKKLHMKIINEVLAAGHVDLKKEEIQNLWKHLIFNAELEGNVPEKIIKTLKEHHHITIQDYTFQKEKLAMVGFTLDEKVSYTYKFLTMIGQVKDFPQFVITSGHGSVSDNNPFESALDCGACGGNISLPNNRALCMMANNVEVREKLKEQGIDIPENVRFIPAMHTTSTDEMTYYDTEVLNKEETEKFNKVVEDFKKASYGARAERAILLPNTETQEDIFIKSMDWSEPRPEWGLAGTMGVYAGPRTSTKNIKFDNRLFLHSYDSTIDNENADILTRIFDGPLVVGEWINLEHYFATVDNSIYGAGSKVYHNVVGKVGVYNGNYSDLKIGLPTQSVLMESKAYHEPVRLLTFMEAPLSIVGKAVENSVAKPFILNEWIRPIIIDKADKKVYSYENGEFIVIKELD